MSIYRTLIDLTSEILIKRTQCFRNLVIVFVVIVLATVGAVIFTLSLWPVFWLLLLIPVYNLFLICDSSKLKHWRAQVIAAWESKEIDISALSQAIKANKALPPATIDGMLESLPQAGELVAEQSISKSTRQAIAVAISERESFYRQIMICKTIFSLIITNSLIIAATINSRKSLILFAAIPVFMLICAYLKRKRSSTLKAKLLNFERKTRFDREKYNEVLKNPNR